MEAAPEQNFNRSEETMQKFHSNLINVSRTESSMRIKQEVKTENHDIENKLENGITTKTTKRPTQKMTHRKAKKTYTYDIFLPPCTVCGGVASGTHFGAITCEACKVFFRRCLAQKYEYKCASQQNCDILSKRRQNCSFCRLKKCKAVGMSKDGVQKGRYTVSKKTDCIRLAKGEDIQTLSSTTQDPTINSTDSPESSHQGALPQRKWVRSPEQTQFYDHIIQQLSEASSNCTIVTQELLDSIPEKEAEAKERTQIEDSVFGLKPLSAEDHRDIFTQTGIDVDGRLESINKCLSSGESSLKKLILFLKAIPGFQMFDIADQIQISKVANWHWVYFTTIPLWNTDTYMYTCPDCQETHTKNDFSKIWDQEYLELLFTMIRRLKALELGPSELAVIKTLSILSIDDHIENIKDRTAVEKQQLVVMETLAYLLEKNRPEDPLAIARIIQLLTDMRTLFYEARRAMIKVYSNHPNLNMPELTFEMMEDDLQKAFSKFRIEDESSTGADLQNSITERSDVQTENPSEHLNT